MVLRQQLPPLPLDILLHSERLEGLQEASHLCPHHWATQDREEFQLTLPVAMPGSHVSITNAGQKLP